MSEIFKIQKCAKFCLCIVLYVVLTSSGGGRNKPPWEKENVSFPMMDLEIKATVDENKRQEDMKKKQDYNTATEVYNKGEWNRFKEKVTKIQDRLRIVSFAIQSIPTGVKMQREIRIIYNNQEKIIQEIESAPYTLVVALPSQIKFVDDLQMTIRLIAGIILSYGAINQMEKAERQILLDYAVDEVKTLRNDSTMMLLKIRELKLKVKRATRAFEYYVNRDKSIVEDILNNIKTF